MAQFPNTTAADGIWTLKKVRRAILGGNWPEAVTADEFFANTVLLLQADDFADGSQNNTFLDSSTNAHTITRNGNVTQGSFSPFSQDEGKWGNYFDGSDYIQAPDSDDFYFDSDFTLEAWIYRTSSSTLEVIMVQWISGGARNVQFEVRNNQLSLYMNRGGVNYQAVGGTLSPNTWYHVAGTLSGTTLSVFINGQNVGSTTVANSPNNITAPMEIGSNAGSYSFTGYISNARIIKGTALYTSAFTPPTEPLTDITNTSLLTCQSNRFVDNSSNAHSITVTGTPEVTPFSPFAPSTAYDPTTKGGSGYFDANGDWLDVAGDYGFIHNPVNGFTIEFNLYRNNTNEHRLFGDAISSNDTGFGVFVLSNGDLQFRISKSVTNDFPVDTVLATNVEANQWNHIAITCDGSTIRAFVNGELGGTTVDISGLTFDTGSQSGNLFVGRIRGSTLNFLDGYLSDIRFISNTALYTSAFTPPTAPLTNITNTSLLCNFTNAGIYDGTGRNVLETVGNAQVDTAVFKYGTGSMQFDGNDHLEIPNSPQLSFVAGEKWTMEMWINPAGNYSDFNSLIVKRTVGSYPYHLFLNKTTGYLAFFNGTEYSSTSTPTANVWSHVAYVYDGTNLNIYLNGTSVLSTAVTMYDTDTIITIGNRGDTDSYYYIGYIDDLRITKGVARYTANFTPPADKLKQQ